MEGKEIQKSGDQGLSKRSETTSITLTTGTLDEIKEKGIQVSKLKRENKELLLIEIVKIINRVFQVVNVKRPLSEEGSIIVAESIILDFWYLKIEEISYCFNQGVKGHYGKILDRLDGAIFFDWLNQYVTSDEYISLSEKKARSFKENEKKGRNKSILEMPGIVDKLSEHGLLDKRKYQKLTDEEKKEHREMIEKQAQEILKSDQTKKT